MLIAIPLALAAGLAIGHSTIFADVLRQAEPEYTIVSTTEPAQVVLNQFADSCTQNGGNATQSKPGDNNFACTLDEDGRSASTSFTVATTHDGKVRFSALTTVSTPKSVSQVFNGIAYSCNSWGGHVQILDAPVALDCIFEEPQGDLPGDSAVEWGIKRLDAGSIEISAVGHIADSKSGDTNLVLRAENHSGKSPGSK